MRSMPSPCTSIQSHAPESRALRHELILVNLARPFYKWGIDIMCPFPLGPINVKFLILVIDYFTKWVETKPLATINGRRVRIFFGKTMSEGSKFYMKL